MTTLNSSKASSEHVSIPEVYLPVGKLGPPSLGQRPMNRPILAFFAGRVHGEIRKTMKSNGYEVASPRVVEAIAGCVPVIICNSYSLPFSDVLNWSQFSVEIPVEKIPEIKTTKCVKELTSGVINHKLIR
ncbi:hypothetical protein VNO77_24238 [Canavalia gladiata]|uniref:Exostosin GT47 domain-containing protein n=1 Tax=Canavalia gladiata TaxID=3824 RepID=A0AAN9LB87_CANGL